MSFTKRTYVDRNTIITAENLNDIQDELIRLGSLNSVYIGAVQPTDGALYWLDTSDSGGVAEEYSITVNLTNVSIDNAATSITEGDSYAAALTADEGYALSTVTVTMGGANVTNTAYASGSIYIASVTGDIVVTATATEIPAATPVYAITNNLLHATSDNAAVSAEENTAYTATLTADTDYTLDGATVTVTMGGTDVTAEVYADGVINIPAVTGDVVIAVVAVEESKAELLINVVAADVVFNKYTDNGQYNIAAKDGAKVYEVPVEAGKTYALCIIGCGQYTNPYVTNSAFRTDGAFHAVTATQFTDFALGTHGGVTWDMNAAGKWYNHLDKNFEK